MVNYFELLGLPVQLPVDVTQLTAHYQQLQRQYHPDNFATVADSDKVSIIQKSATINDGYHTLKNPIKAAEYFLSLKGFDVVTEQNIIHDTDFLMEQFALREQLDDIESQANFEALDSFHEEIIERQKTVYNELLQFISKQNWQIALNQIYKIRYLTRLIEQIEKLQEKQFDL
ncbi:MULTISPECIES: Fe-S protein assembly co-chaperone HscB [unclassified Gilliamella]|uniref:Fe-S protein assembly co-chaperone HscB n=1 Tax=unclassified Gilliamella TaxID=2685620 RepID=UPI001307F001|nr:MULTISPECIES: Fe-S protein assembly co-chaperone HscB [unclassified Gilliamella]MWP49272.1 Fe-S protein assembly co-chaperone HscB [Gilliamella sp. Lep-s35]MWP67966.1 Fe-S protein assembly co-chaperone HscB [Gilliamella sp. Lep-s5]MWP76186.1 Fe-S protein assembly co-chaperone HscB [Gilliamella sp. Lep-s21]